MVPGRPFFSRLGEEGELDFSGVTNSIFNVRLDGLNRIDRLNENGWTWDVEEKEEKEVKKICATIRMSKGEGIRDEQTLLPFV